jgi:hypothetical protein
VEQQAAAKTYEAHWRMLYHRAIVHCGQEYQQCALVMKVFGEGE